MLTLAVWKVSLGDWQVQGTGCIFCMFTVNCRTKNFTCGHPRDHFLCRLPFLCSLSRTVMLPSCVLSVSSSQPVYIIQKKLICWFTEMFHYITRWQKREVVIIDWVKLLRRTRPWSGGQCSGEHLYSAIKAGNKRGISQHCDYSIWSHDGKKWTRPWPASNQPFCMTS